MQSSQPRESGWKLSFKAGAILFFGLFVLASNTVGSDMAALPPILLFIAIAFFVCLQ